MKFEVIIDVTANLLTFLSEPRATNETNKKKKCMAYFHITWGLCPIKRK